MTEDLAGKLSPRMEELCTLVVRRDLSYKRAALAMGISVHTARNYAEEIGRRLGRSPSQAMAMYYWNVLHEEGGDAA